MGIYSNEARVSFKASYVIAIAEANGLPVPRTEDNFAYLSQDEVDAWINAADQEDCDKHVYLIGQVFKDYKFGRMADEDSSEASYNITFA